VKHFVAAMRLVGSRPLRSALRMALTDRSAVWAEQEAAI